MSLVQDTIDLERSIREMRNKAAVQQAVYFRLIREMVAMQQKHRVAKNYAVSDEIRTLLSGIGVTITQGTDGMTLEQIEKRFKGKPQPPVGDTWDLDLEKVERLLFRDGNE